MAVCLFYQEETLRVRSRAISITEVLQGRGKPVYAQQVLGMPDLRKSSAEVLVLSDWKADIAVQRNPGTVLYWDTPENIASRLYESAYSQLAREVDGFIAHTVSQGRVLQSFKKPVVYLPSGLPLRFLHERYRTQRDAGMGLFGYHDLTKARHALSQIRVTHPQFILATDDQLLAQQYQPAVHTIPDPASSIPLMSRTRVLLSPQSTTSHADPLWSLAALYYGKPVITTHTHEEPLREHGIVTVSDEAWGRTLYEILANPGTWTRSLAERKASLAERYSTHSLAGRYWKAFEAMARQQYTMHRGGRVPSSLIAGTAS